MMPWWQQLAIALIGGASAAYATMHLSLRRFYLERWWQRRFDAYSAILEALHDQHRYLDILRGEIFDGDRYLDGYRQNALTLSTDAGRLLRRYVDLGPLALSPEAVAALRAFLNTSDPDADIDDLVIADLVKAEQAIRQISMLSMIDLRLSTKTWRSRLPFRRHVNSASFGPSSSE